MQPLNVLSALNLERVNAADNTNFVLQKKGFCRNPIELERGKEKNCWREESTSRQGKLHLTSILGSNDVFLFSAKQFNFLALPRT